MTRLVRTGAALLFCLGTFLIASPPPEAEGAKRGSRVCPAEMARVGNYCIDRWEMHTVDATTGEPLSPYYPPEPKLLSFVHEYWMSEQSRMGPERARRFPLPEVPDVQRGEFAPLARSAPDVVPQAYLTYFSARTACARAGKRLCSEEEWTRACRSAQGTKHPYGEQFELGRCNVFRQVHPAHELHGNSSVGHLDPRLNLVWEDGKRPLLEKTGTREACVARFQADLIYDLVGNLDEWIEDPEGVFVGGFYARPTRSGCEARVDNHVPQYTDYSLGARCCRDTRE